METLEQIKTRIEVAVPGATVETVRNASPGGLDSLLVDSAHALAIAGLLPWVSHVTILSGRPLTPPLAFHWLTRICAAATEAAGGHSLPIGTIEGLCLSRHIHPWQCMLTG